MRSAHDSGSLVLLIGWAGATPRHLRGHVAWYRERGWRTEVVVPRTYANMARRGGWEEQGAEVARALPRTGPLLVHAFSNAGFWTWVATIGAMDREALARVRGAVLDSAPGIPATMDRKFVVRFATMAMMPQALQMIGRPAALQHPLLTPVLGAFFRLWIASRPDVLGWAEQSLVVARETGDWPTLLLYGGADRLVPARFVEAFARSLEEAGRKVTSLEWPESDHVQHFVRHRAEYFERLGRFLDEIGQVS